jgi:hypothetical protein
MIERDGFIEFETWEELEDFLSDMIGESEDKSEMNGVSKRVLTAEEYDAFSKAAGLITLRSMKGGVKGEVKEQIFDALSSFVVTLGAMLFGDYYMYMGDETEKEEN